MRPSITGVVPTLWRITHEPSAMCGMILNVPSRSSSLPVRKLCLCVSCARVCACVRGECVCGCVGG